ncbi:WYL domain-containing protein [Phenylobacterium sp.]|uniref:helix-turn-helix transcriptional regulator n=1 Tax=Phenylobacterium sp. TaxID=1871053 RepID=UPI003457DE76|nr:WYL domain-containing protein [Phenylobacterium sp.]
MATRIDALRFPGPGSDPPPRGSPLLEAAISRRLRVTLSYCDRCGFPTLRRVRPLAIVAGPRGALLIAWCERRRDFRNFRLDRICALRPGSRFPETQGKALADYPGGGWI